MKSGAFLTWVFLVSSTIAFGQAGQQGQNGGQQGQGQQGQGGAGCGGQQGGQGGQQGQNGQQQQAENGQQQGQNGAPAAQGNRGNQGYPGTAAPAQASNDSDSEESESEASEGGEETQASRGPVIGGASMASLINMGSGIPEGGYLFSAIAAASGFAPAESAPSAPQVTMDNGDTVRAILSLSPSERLVAQGTESSSTLTGPNLLGSNLIASGSTSAPVPRAAMAEELPARGIGTPPAEWRPKSTIVYGGHRPR
jgi:hypothetical protein